MKTLYNIHWISTHTGGDDEAWFARWNPTFVKVVCNDETIPTPSYIPPASKIIVRNYPLSENYQEGRVLVDVADAQNKGRSAGVAAMRTAEWCEARGINRSRLLFCGLNEPQVYAGEPPPLLAAYEVARLEVLHRWNVRGVVCNFGVGWPGNDGTTGGLPIWGPYAPIINAMLPGDYLGLHEYWALAGPEENWGWWAGRYEKCPYNVPILITECGIDLGVAGQPYGGWNNLPGNHDQQAAQYMNHLVRYEERCRQDARVKGLFIYTYDYGSNHWQEMNIRDSVFMPQFFNYLDWLAPQPEPIPAPLPQSDPPPVPVPVPAAAWTIGPRLRIPVAGMVTQEFGGKAIDYSAFGLIAHNGRDVACPIGTPVTTMHPGVCWPYEDSGGYGNTVEVWYPTLSNNAAYKTIVAHLSEIKVQYGQKVNAGDLLGLSGNTGNSTGPHVHYGIKLLAGKNPGYRDWIDIRPWLA